MEKNDGNLQERRSNEGFRSVRGGPIIVIEEFHISNAIPRKHELA